MKKRKIVLLAFLMCSFVCFGQDKKGKPEMTFPASVSIFGSDTIYTTIFKPINKSYGQMYDVYPQYIGGDSAEVRFINKNMQSPECIRCKGVNDYTGLVITINEAGVVSDASVVKKFPDCEKCDEEAIRITKLMPNWKPAQLDGKNIKIKWDFVIRFNFSK